MGAQAPTGGTRSPAAFFAAVFCVSALPMTTLNSFSEATTTKYARNNQHIITHTE